MKNSAESGEKRKLGGTMKNYLKARFWANKKGENKPKARFWANKKGAITLATMILLIFTVIAFGATYPTLVDTIQGVQSGGWNFTGSDGAIVVYSLIPFIVLGAFVISIVRDLIGGTTA